MSAQPSLTSAEATRTASHPAARRYAQVSGQLAEPERDALVEAHLPQVRYIAERLAAKLPPSVELEDLIGAGVMGLLDAANKYDQARGVLFKTYAEMRIRGAILDSLRDLDWAPRSMRRRAREVEATYARLETEWGRAASEEEVAAALGLSLSSFHSLLRELSGLNIMGLESDDSDDDKRAVQIPTDPKHAPAAILERSEVQARLIAAIDRLPERERQVIALYYLEELTMKETGAVLGITESRVSQVHTQAVVRLRAALSPLRQSGVDFC